MAESKSQAMARLIREGQQRLAQAAIDFGDAQIIRTEVIMHMMGEMWEAGHRAGYAEGNRQGRSDGYSRGYSEGMYDPNADPDYH